MNKHLIITITNGQFKAIVKYDTEYAWWDVSLYEGEDKVIAITSAWVLEDAIALCIDWLS